MAELKPLQRMLLTGLLLAGSWLSARPADAQCASTTVNPWRRWESTILASNNYTNPYKDVIVKVEYTNAANAAEKYSTYAFWDGRNGSNQDVFKIRTAFGSGTWNWNVISCTNNGMACNDSNLQNACGTITVNNVVIGGQSPLYDHGFLKQPTNGMRQLVSADGTPFFWLGDTAWNAMMSATTANWQTYVTTRGQVNQGQTPQNFTVVQVAPAPNYAALGSGIPVPFNPMSCSGTPPIDSCTVWNPAYWQQVDTKVNAANAAGMVVVLAGVMDPTDLGNINAAGTVVAAYPDTASARTFARNLAARMFGNFVVFSPGFDDRTSKPIPNALAIAVGNEIKGATARHLVTYHPGGEANLGDASPTAPQNLHSQNRPSGGWLSFDMVHSGHVATDSGLTQLSRAVYRARVFPQRLAYDSTFYGSVILPVVNGEAAYDGGPTITDTNDIAHTYRSRQYGYVTMLSGAYGYIFGASNLYNWTASWSAPLSWASATQMGILRNIFQTVTWYQLIGSPAEHTRIENQVVNEYDKMVVGYDTNNALVAYLPAPNSSIELYLSDITTFPGSWSKTWYSPRTGASQGATPNFLAAGGGKRARYSFTKPACDGTCAAATNDWVLILKKTSPFAAASALSTDEMRLWSAPQEDGSSPVLYALESPGRTVGKETRISSAESTLERFPRVAATPGRGYVTVWQSRGEGDEGEDVWVRRFLPSGKPAGDELRVNGTVRGDQTLPAVSAAAKGDFVVVWAGRDPETEGSDIFAQRFDADGRPDGGEIRVNTTTAGEQSFPLIAAAPGGDFVVAWESQGADGGTSIRLQRFAASGRPVGNEILAGAPIRGTQRLTNVEILPSGEARVEWAKRTSSGESLGLSTRTFGR